MLRQSTDRKLSLVIRRESSMPNSLQPVRDTSKHRNRIADETPPPVTPTEQPQPAPGEQSWIARALSWLGGCIVEGFAAYGESICPCLVDLPENQHRQTDKPHRPAHSPLPVQENPWVQARVSHDVDIYEWLASAPSSAPRNRRRWFRLLAFWPKRHTVGRKQSLCDPLDLPDDRVLRESRVERHEIGAAPQWFGPFR
jgi:hypothetical protein